MTLKKPPGTQTDSTALADLIIDTITYKRLPNTFLGSPSGVIGITGQYLEFAIRVKNIGRADFPYKLFILNTRTESEIQIGHYSHGQEVYYENGMPQSVPAGRSIEVKTEDVVDEGVCCVKFLISTDGKPHLKRPDRKYPESNYDNNTYMLELE